MHEWFPYTRRYVSYRPQDFRDNPLPWVLIEYFGSIQGKRSLRSHELDGLYGEKNQSLP